MKKFWFTFLGAAVVSTTLSLAITPVVALGGCGANYHRDGNGNCVFGGQNQDYCLKTKGHPATRMPNGTLVCSKGTSSIKRNNTGRGVNRGRRCFVV